METQVKPAKIFHDDEACYADCPKCGGEGTITLHDDTWWGTWERDDEEIECDECKATFSAAWCHSIDISFHEKDKTRWDPFAEGAL